MPGPGNRSLSRGQVQKYTINIVKIRLFYIWVVSGTFEVCSPADSLLMCKDVTDNDYSKLSNFKLRRKHKTIA